MDTELIADIKKGIPRMLSEIKSMKGYAYKRLSRRDTIESMTAGIIPADLPLTITAEEGE